MKRYDFVPSRFHPTFNPKKHQDDRRKNRPLTTAVGSSCLINPSRLEAARKAWANNA